ncbi:hypothetical protein J437_LFUL015392 [Ladona fulva]|uniref:E3 ubiquitin-protein ligase RFWD3-like WD40 domain-containing protein n=1 Tax=Ladona fulva TaxID=123851 RepID=A0A8K0P741_LADFU|nr:hypothetical protein J437_LFUL015392 [Ladona fulva]
MVGVPVAKLFFPSVYPWIFLWLQTELDQLIRARVGAAMLPQPNVDVTLTDVNQPSTTFEGIGQDGLPFHFALVSTVEISRDGGCRVAAFCDPLNLMVVSQRSTNPLFPGFGVKKVDALEFRATQFVPAHQKPIRDLAFSPTSRSLLLSASFDCTARLLDVGSGSNAVVATLSAESPLWSCCWDACDTNLLHVGSQGRESPGGHPEKAAHMSFGGQSIMNRSRANNAMSRFIGFDLSRGIGIRINLSSDDEEEDSLHSNTSNASDDQDIEEEQALLFALDRQSEGGVRSPDLSDISTDFVPIMEPGYNMEDENRHVRNAFNLGTEQLAGPTNPSEVVDPSSSVPEPSLFITAENSPTVGDQVASTSSPPSAADSGRPGDGAPDTGITAAGGVILSFDIRNTNAPISRKTDPEDVSPIIALVPIPPSTGRSLPLGGLMSCHLSTCWAHDKSSNESQSMPFDGSFTSLRYEPTTQHFLISSRPCSRAPHVRHHVCERSFRRVNENSGMSSVCNPPVHTFLGGTTQKVLSRSCLVPVGRDLLVAAHQESSSTVALWSVGRGGRVATIPASDPVIDTCPLVVNRETHVALLTEKVLRLYKIR